MHTALWYDHILATVLLHIKPFPSVQSLLTAEKKKKNMYFGVSCPQLCNSMQFYSTSRATATEAEGATAGPSGQERFQGLWAGYEVPHFLLLLNEGSIYPASRQHFVI